MAFDVSGLTPLDPGGLDRFDGGSSNRFDTSGLTRLDTSEFIPPATTQFRQPSDVGRTRTGVSSFVRGLGQTISGLPKSVPLITAPDSSIFRNLDRIERGEPAQPSQMQMGSTMQTMSNPYEESLFSRYSDASTEQRQVMRRELEGQVEQATESPLYRAGQKIDEWIAESFPVKPELQDEFWNSKVPQALGSGVGFLTMAALTRGFAGPYVAPAVLGSMMNRVDQFEQALDEGSEIGAALHASEIGAIIGISEAVPIGNLFTRLDKGSGGAVRRYLTRAIVQGTEEAVQESFSGIMNEAVAQQLYDPERGIWTMERAEEGATGFVTGAILETLVTLALPGRVRFSGARRQRAEDREPVDDLSTVDDVTVGERERSRAATPEVSPEDVASPLPTELIAEGREILADAQGEMSAERILDSAGFPPINSRVIIDGRSATVVDAYDSNGVRGVKMRYEDGRVLAESFDALRGRVVPTEAEDGAREEETATQGDGFQAAQDILQTEAPVGGITAAVLPTEREPEDGMVHTMRDGTVMEGREHDGSVSTRAIRPIEEAPTLPVEEQTSAIRDDGPSSAEIGTTAIARQPERGAGAEPVATLGRPATVTPDEGRADRVPVTDQAADAERALAAQDSSTLVAYLRRQREKSVEINRTRSGAKLGPAQREAFLAGYDRRVAEIEGTEPAPLNEQNGRGLRRNAFERGQQAVGFYVGEFQKTAAQPMPSGALPRTRLADSRQVSAEKGGAVARGTVDEGDVVTDRINRAIRDFAMEQQGQAILDDLEESGTSPRNVATQFWRSTYPRLNGGTQHKFRRYVERLSGFKPGDTVGTNADGSSVVAETPLDLADFVNEDLAGETQHLQDIERGYVAMMAWANQQADQREGAKPEDAQPDRQTDLVAADVIDAITAPDGTTRTPASRVEPAPALAPEFTVRYLNDGFSVEAVDSQGNVIGTMDTAVGDIVADMGVNDGWRRRGVATAMFGALRQNHPDMGFSGTVLTADGRAFAEAITAPTVATKIKDFGEILEGARKHAWEAYRDRLGEAGDVAAEPLSKSWPEPDYQKLIDGGADQWGVAFIRSIRDEVPTKPRQGWKLKQWVGQTTQLRKFATQVLDGLITREQITEALASPEFSRLKQSMEGRIDLYQAVGHEKSLKGVRLASAQYSMQGGQKIDPPRVIWTIERKAKATAFSNWPTTLAQGDTREEAIADFKKRYAEIDTQPVASAQIKFSIYSYRSGPKSGKWIIGKKIGKDRVDLREFEAVKEARKYLNEHQDELEKALARYKDIPNERKESDSPRVGTDYRYGADVTPEIFTETFSFKGVQFGNYVEQGRRQQDLNEAYDALMDLAGVLNVPPKALSLNGELGLAFGARGKGGKLAPRAHYEADTIVINLTKREGAGSLGHEWFHGLDNYFSRRGGQRTGFVTVGARGEGVRPEVLAAFTELNQAIKRTSLRERSKGLDRRRTTPYWSTGEEMAARAFESYIIAKLQDQGQSNDYLANIVSEDYWKAAAALGIGEGTEQQPDYPYPTAAEIPEIRAGFDQLFETIETRETEQGVEMFSIGEDATYSLTPEAREKYNATMADLQARLDQIGISDKVTLRLREVIKNKVGASMSGANGRYYARTIELAINDKNKRATLDHEIVHALKDLGVIRPAEWRVLERAALDDKALMESVRNRYASLELSDAKLVEEAIAEMHSRWNSGQLKARGFIQRAFERIRDFLEALGNAFRGNGFQSASDVFSRIGEIGRRAPKAGQEGEAFSLPDRPRFDPARASIAMESTPQEKAPFSSRFIDEAIFRFQDKFNYLAKAQKAAAREKGRTEVEEAEDVYLAELRYHGMAGAAIEDFQREHVEPLIDAVSKSGLSIDDVDRYLHARHATEANAKLREINPDRADNDALSGMSDQEAARVIDGFTKNGQIASLEAVAKQVDAITKAQRDLLRESGLERPKTIDQWEATYTSYVPLHREGFDAQPARGKGFSVTGRQKRRAGSERAVEHVVAHVVSQHEATIVRAEKNKVAKAMLEFARNNPNTDLYEVDKVEFKPTFDAEGLVTYRPQRGFQFAENVLIVKVDGVDHTISFNERSHEAMRIVRSLKNLGADHSGPILNVLTKFTRYLALVNTGANPEFIISNFARDLQTAGYNLSSTEADSLKWQIIRDVGKSWRGIRAFQKGKESPWAAHFDEFRKAGAQTGWMAFYRDIDHRERTLVNMVKEMRGGSLVKIRRGLRSVMDFIDNENTAVENAVRLSAFVHARRAGLSEGQSARLAKELTVNFNRKGDYGQIMNALYLFYNASIQGSARLIVAGAKSRKVRVLMGATVVAATFLDMANRALGGDDDDGVPRYDKIPDYVKERNLIVMLPEGRGDYLTIPLPWGYNVFHVMGQVSGEALTKKNFKATEGAMRVAGAVFSSFNPIGSEASITQMVSPTIMDPMVQWSENKDWTGRQIRPEGNPFDVDMPASQQYWNSVREPSRWVTEKLNELTGGSDVRSGAVDINPEVIDLLIDTFTGGAGRFVSDTLSTPIKAVQGQDIESYEIPLLRRLYGKPGVGTLFQEYYRNADAVRITEKEARHFIETGDRKALMQLRRERRGEYAMIETRKSVDSEIRKLRAQKNRLKASTLADRQQRIREDQIDARIEQLMNHFNRTYNARVSQ